MKAADPVTAARVEIVPMTPDREAAYAAFVAAHPEAMLYHSLPYLKLVASLTRAGQRTLLALDHAGAIAGVLPMLSQDGPLGRVLNSLPFYGSHGGVLAATPAAGHALTAAYNAEVVANDVCAATLVGNPLAAAPADVRHSLQDYRIGQFSRIAFGERHAANLMDLYHHKTRNMVRKGEKSGVQAAEENGMLDFLMEVHRDNMRDIGGRAKSERFFEGLPAHFRPGTDYRLFVARVAGEPVAAMLLFYFRDIVEYYMPVIRESFRDRQPLSLLIHRAMTEASERGCRLWNWGGTWATQESVYFFKKRWGSHDVKYTYFIQLNNDAVLDASREALLEAYPNFFVVPFQQLRTAH